MITVTIKGPDLAAAAMSANVRIEANSEIALDTVSSATEGDAKAECPVRTGELRDDIKTYRAKLLRQIGNNKFYAPFVHNGTYKMKGRPYLLNAFNKNSGSLIPEIQRLGT